MVTEFNNARLFNQNFSFGPDTGRIYSIDYVTDSMLVKGDPAGVPDVPVPLIKTLPLSINITSEVRTLQFDGHYFWTQRDIGGSSVLGTLIEKWAVSHDGNVLIKQFGVGSEFSLVNTPSNKFSSEAMAIHTLDRTFTAPVSSGSYTVSVSDTTSLQPGDKVYLGPNSSNEREEVEIASTGVGVINLVDPTVFNYTSGESVIIRKNLWIFNNYNGLDSSSGKLYQYSTYNGFIVSESSSNEWKDITAATSYDSSLYFVRDSQFLVYSPFGVNKGYLTSGLLNNTESDNNTLIKVYDISINNSAISKLQKSLTYFQDLSKTFIDIPSTDDLYNIEREFFAAKVKSLTTHRNRSVLLGEGILSSLIIEMRDQYNIPILGRAVVVSEDDTTGSIVPGTESFITDSLGQGTTIYQTGVNPEFFQPTITSVDVVTGLRVNSRLDQLRGVLNNNFIDQFSANEGIGNLVQYLTVGDMPVVQRAKRLLEIPVEQTRPGDGIKYIDQVLRDNSLPIEQIIDATGVSFIEQLPSVSNITSLDQYEFLIFAVPAPFSIKNDPTTSILVRIVGFGSLVLDSSTLSFVVNGVEVASQVNITPFIGGLELEYSPTVPFAYGTRVTVEISIQDDDVPPNTVYTKYYFDIIDDFRRPILSQVYPPDQSVGNSSTTQVFAVVQDLETGIDEDSIEFYVEGRLVPHVVTEPSEGSVKVLYEPTCPFPYGEEITASIVVEDLFGNRLIETWTFYVQQSPGVLFIDTVPENCQVLVPVDTELCSEVFGLEEGVYIDSLTFNINGESVQYVLKPKVYRKE